MDTDTDIGELETYFSLPGDGLSETESEDTDSSVGSDVAWEMFLENCRN